MIANHQINKSGIETMLTNNRAAIAFCRTSAMALWITATVIFTGCEPVNIHQFRTIGGDWQSNDTITFTLSISESYKTTNSMELQLRNTREYPYSDIWIRVEKDYGNRVETDTIQCFLYDNYGKPLGSTLGRLYQNSFQLATINLSHNDSLVVKINHIMDNYSVKGINDVGIRLLKHVRHQSSEN